MSALFSNMSEKLGSDLSYEFVFLSFWQYSVANATRNGLRFLLKTIQTKAVFLSQNSNHKKRMSGAAWKCLRWNVELVWKIQVIIWIFFLESCQLWIHCSWHTKNIYFADFKESHMLLYICSPVTRVSLNGWLIFTVSQERSAQDREALSRHSAWLTGNLSAYKKPTLSDRK